MVDKKDLRREYRFGALEFSDLDKSPFQQFAKWFKAADEAGLIDVSAMALATCDSSTKPSVRIVLLKHFDETGLCWYTDYSSLKGRQLAENDRCEVLFYWKELERQVRISGRVIKLSADESDRYFLSRPIESQIAASVSHQSQPIENRELLDGRAEELVSGLNVVSLDRPDRWGGYRLIPEEYEFWQGREGRLHDRFRYLLEREFWGIVRLQP